MSSKEKIYHDMSNSVYAIKTLSTSLQSLTEQAAEKTISPDETVTLNESMKLIIGECDKLQNHIKQLAR